MIMYHSLISFRCILHEIRIKLQNISWANLLQTLMEPPLNFRSKGFFEFFPILSIAFVTVWAVNCNFLSLENIVFSAYCTVTEYFLAHFNLSSRWWFNNFYIFLNFVLAFDFKTFQSREIWCCCAYPFWHFMSSKDLFL